MNTIVEQPMPCVAEDDNEAVQHEGVAPAPVPLTPRQFYEEITKRPDVRAILEALADTQEARQPPRMR